MLGIAILAMAEIHIKTNSMGLQCVASCGYECTITDMNDPLQVRRERPILHSGTQKTAVAKKS